MSCRSESSGGPRAPTITLSFSEPVPAAGNVLASGVPTVRTPDVCWAGLQESFGTRARLVHAVGCRAGLEGRHEGEEAGGGALWPRIARYHLGCAVDVRGGVGVGGRELLRGFEEHLRAVIRVAVVNRHEVAAGARGAGGDEAGGTAVALVDVLPDVGVLAHHRLIRVEEHRAPSFDIPVR